MHYEFNPFNNEGENTALRKALADFIADYLAHPGEQDYMPWEMDISDPHLGDMDSINKKNFEITNLRITPGVKGSRSFHFYVGRIEFHVAGRAAGRIENVLRRAA